MFLYHLVSDMNHVWIPHLDRPFQQFVGGWKQSGRQPDDGGHGVCKPVNLGDSYIIQWLKLDASKIGAASLSDFLELNIACTQMARRPMAGQSNATHMERFHFKLVKYAPVAPISYVQYHSSNILTIYNRQRSARHIFSILIAEIDYPTVQQIWYILHSPGLEYGGPTRFEGPFRPVNISTYYCFKSIQSDW